MSLSRIAADAALVRPCLLAMASGTARRVRTECRPGVSIAEAMALPQLRACCWFVLKLSGVGPNSLGAFVAGDGVVGAPARRRLLRGVRRRLGMAGWLAMKERHANSKKLEKFKKINR